MASVVEARGAEMTTVVARPTGGFAGHRSELPSCGARALTLLADATKALEVGALDSTHPPSVRSARARNAVCRPEAD